MSVNAVLGPVALCVALSITGCSSQDSGEAPTGEAASEAPPAIEPTSASATACLDTQAVLNSVTAPPDASQASAMASELDAIAAVAPDDIGPAISGVRVALVKAASARDGFNGTSTQSLAFDEALQSLGQVCAGLSLGQ